MALPLLFIGIAAATGGFGIGKSVKAGIDNARADSINRQANTLVQEAADHLKKQKEACGRALRVLGELKMFVLNSSITEFLNTFTQKDKAEMYIIYADRCILTEEEMMRMNIRFKKIPRDIKRV